MTHENQNLREELADYTRQLQSVLGRLTTHRDAQGDRPTRHGDETNVRIVAVNGLLSRLATTSVDELNLSVINQITTDVNDVLTSANLFLGRAPAVSTSG